MNHQFEELARAHGRFAEDRPDIEDADSTHLQEVAEHAGAAALERVGRNPVDLDDIVGDKPVAARNELQRELALADRRRAGDEHAHLEHVEEYAVERRRLR